MINAILWPLVWFLVRTVLDVSKGFVTVAITAVADAETQKNKDGSPLSGPQKRAYVMGELEKLFSNTDWASKSKKVANVIVELAVNYVKGYIDKQ